MAAPAWHALQLIAPAEVLPADGARPPAHRPLRQLQPRTVRFAWRARGAWGRAVYSGIGWRITDATRRRATHYGTDHPRAAGGRRSKRASSNGSVRRDIRSRRGEDLAVEAEAGEPEHRALRGCSHDDLVAPR